MKNILLIAIFSLLISTVLAQNSNKVVNVKANEIDVIGILPVISSVNILKVNDEKVSQEFINQTNSVTNRIAEQSLDSLFKLINLPSKKIELDSTSIRLFAKDVEYYFTFIKS